MLKRTSFLKAIQLNLKVHPVCGLLGPRQCGKTTLARQIADEYPERVHFFDLEHPEDLAALEQPLRTLEQLHGLVIIDEIQRLPNLFPVLRVLADKQQAHYLILGSASRELIRQSSESLAGRIGYVELTPLQISENCDSNKLLIQGGFPRSYLADTTEESFVWRNSYVQTFLERDIPNLGFNIPAVSLRRFWMMLAHVHGQLLNMSVLATSLGVSTHTIRSYLDILAGTFMIRVLMPWFENIHKRQVKSPKIYFRDNGILLNLLNISNHTDLLRYPQLGAIWEGFALEQVIDSLSLRSEEVFFWRTQNGAELDLLIFHEGKRLGFEFKYADIPKTTKSMHAAVEDLHLDYLYIIYPGNRQFSLTDKITAIGLVDWVGQSR